MGDGVGCLPTGLSNALGLLRVTFTCEPYDGDPDLIVAEVDGVKRHDD